MDVVASRFPREQSAALVPSTKRPGTATSVALASALCFVACASDDSAVPHDATGNVNGADGSTPSVDDVVCHAYHRTYPVGAETKFDCWPARCQDDGRWSDGGGEPCFPDVRGPVMPCAELFPDLDASVPVPSNPITVGPGRFEADWLTVELSYPYDSHCSYALLALCYREPVDGELALEFVRDDVECHRAEGGVGNVSEVALFDVHSLHEQFDGLYETRFGPIALGDATCEERTEATAAQLEDLLDAQTAGCTTDADCLTVPGPHCTGQCPVPVAVEASDPFSLAISRIDYWRCEPFENGECDFTPTCTDRDIGCVEGRCQEL